MKPAYEYSIKDHLGNTAVLFEDKNADGLILTELGTNDPTAQEVLKRDFYYPFGMSMEGEWQVPITPTPAMNYLYNGKELDEQMGWYFYGFRMYDPSIGRFTGVDPIADQFAFVSVYNYAENDPIGNIDLHGLQKVSFNYTFGLNVQQTAPRWVPFGHRFYNASLTEGSISNLNIDFNAPRSYNIKFNIPARISATSSGYVINSWDTYNSRANSLEKAFDSDNWELQNNYMRSFAEGLILGWNTAAFEGAGELIFAQLYSKALSKLSRTINMNKQASHIVGSNSYKIRTSQGKTPSILTGNAQELLDDVFNANISSIQKAGQKYRVDFGRTIGKYIDETGEAIETTVGVISTGKNGAHIVPGRPKK